MTQTVTRPPDTPPPPPELTAKGRTVLADRLFFYLCIGAGVMVLVVLALILISTVREGWPAFQHEGLGFILDSRWRPNDPDGDGPQTPLFGALAFIYGTMVCSALALLFAVPVSVGIALFLTELAPQRLRGPVVTVIDLLATVPSVVFGLWGILVVAPALAPVYTWIHERVENIPVVGTVLGPPVSSGRNFMTAGLILAIMITPIITSISREVVATVPETEKHAALALGATRWEMIKGAVLPHSFGGLVGAIMLGLGRAMGETIALALVLGSSVQITTNLLESGYALPAVIVQQWGESTGLHREALVALGVILFVITIAVNYLARLVVRRAEVRLKGATA